MKISKRLPAFIKNKYFLTLIIFFVWILLFDRNNLIDRFKKIKELRQLEKDRIYYQEWIESDKKRMDALRTSTDNLEKFAREEYYMKKDNEDIFIIMQEE